MPIDLIFGFAGLFVILVFIGVGHYLDYRTYKNTGKEEK